MLYFDGVKITDFMGVAGTEYIDLTPAGLTLVVGKNGGGKSSRYSEAITWVLFGDTLRPELTVNDVIQKDAAVVGVSLSVRDTDESAQYLVSRVKARTSAQALVVTREGVPVFLSANLSETQKKLEAWLGLDFKTFTNSIVFGQGLASFFASGGMSDSERKDIFDRIYGLDEYDAGFDLADTHYKEAVEVLEKSRTDRDRVVVEKETHQNALLGNKVAETGWLSDRTRHRETLVKQADEAKVRLDDTKKKVTEQVATVQALVLQERECRKLLDADGLQNMQSEITLTENTSKELKEFFTQLMAQHAVAFGTIRAAEEKLKELSVGATVKPDDRVCPTCGQRIGSLSAENRIAEAVVTTTAKLANAKKEKAELDGQLKQTKEDYELLTAELEKQRSEMKDKQADLTKIVTRLGEVVESRRTAEQWQKNAEDAYGVALDTLTNFDHEVNPYTVILEGNNKAIAEAEKKEVEIEIRLKEEFVRMDVYEFWRDAFGPKGIKAFIIEGLLPNLNRLANEHLYALTGGGFSVEVQATTALKKGTTAERMSVKVVNEHGAQVYAGNSGGEKRRIDLAILLALQDLVALRAQRSISLCVYDEILDAMDDESILRAVSYLQTRAREGNKPTFLISHNDSARALVDNVIEVKAA